MILCVTQSGFHGRVLAWVAGERVCVRGQLDAHGREDGPDFVEVARDERASVGFRSHKTVSELEQVSGFEPLTVPLQGRFTRGGQLLLSW